MKTNNENVAHNFIYGVKSHSGNFYSDDYTNISTLESYNSLLAIKFKKENLIIISKRIANYSNTSIRHASHLKRAINNEDVIYIEDFKYQSFLSDKKISDFLTKEELSDKIKEFIEISKKQKRAIKSDYSRLLKTIIKEMQLIVEYAKIDKRSKEFKLYNKIVNNLDLDALINDALKAEKIENEKRAKNRYKRNLEKAFSFTGVKLNYNSNELENYHLLKVVGDQLKTNGGVSVELKDAIILYKAFIKGKSVVGQKIGYYTILKANEKEVKIGCHNILTKELKRVLGGVA